MPKIDKQTPTRTTPTRNTPARPNGVISQLRSAWDLDDTLSLLLYGESGSGKTTLWGTFPGPTLAIICSGGQRPGELKSINTEEHRAKITPVIVDQLSTLSAVLKEARAGFATVVLDHVSGLQDLSLKEILGIDELPVQKGWGLASQQQWGQSTAQCKEILRELLSLPCHRVIVGQQRTFGGSDDGASSDIIKPTVGVSVTPSLAGWLNPACDYVLQCFKRPRMRKITQEIAGQKTTITERDEGVEYCVRCEPHDIFMTKFRLPRTYKVPRVIVDPTYAKILTVIQGKWNPTERAKPTA